MFRSLVAAVTLLAVTACPFRCATGACGEAAGEAQRCQCCPASPTECGDDSSQPLDAPGGEGCQCQGVCGGAVLPDAPELDGTVGAFLPGLTAADWLSSPARARSPRRLVPDAAPRPVGGAALRIQLSSLLN
ncbi:hypothetical protein [Alienimonas californiensis]|uniref:hypothetical protein n=1 Tax=Alienimonas californiensis TaxID=2527989 RepID=UPI0013FD09D9|nr:hypothetical protein [Alienimonas californiensis]